MHRIVKYFTLLCTFYASQFQSTSKFQSYIFQYCIYGALVAVTSESHQAYKTH